MNKHRTLVLQRSRFPRVAEPSESHIDSMPCEKCAALIAKADEMYENPEFLLGALMPNHEKLLPGKFFAGIEVPDCLVQCLHLPPLLRLRIPDEYGYGFPQLLVQPKQTVFAGRMEYVAKMTADAAVQVLTGHNSNYSIAMHTSTKGELLATLYVLCRPKDLERIRQCVMSLRVDDCDVEVLGSFDGYNYRYIQHSKLERPNQVVVYKQFETTQTNKKVKKHK